MHAALSGLSYQIQCLNKTGFTIKFCEMATPMVLIQHNKNASNLHAKQYAVFVHSLVGQIMI